MSNTISLAEKFANSEKFKELFRDGMDLVEESATFLDGEGREIAKTLPRNVAMLYGSESMRLTTRLMQLASWLLLQRAANEGEMTRDQLLEEKQKVKLSEFTHQTNNPGWPELPAEFLELVDRSVKLQKLVINLDRELYADAQTTGETESGNNPVGQQQELLSAAFGTNKNN